MGPGASSSSAIATGESGASGPHPGLGDARGPSRSALSHDQSKDRGILPALEPTASRSAAEFPSEHRSAELGPPRRIPGFSGPICLKPSPPGKRFILGVADTTPAGRRFQPAETNRGDGPGPWTSAPGGRSGPTADGKHHPESGSQGYSPGGGRRAFPNG